MRNLLACVSLAVVAGFMLVSCSSSPSNTVDDVVDVRTPDAMDGDTRDATVDDADRETLDAPGDAETNTDTDDADNPGPADATDSGCGDGCVWDVPDSAGDDVFDDAADAEFDYGGADTGDSSTNIDADSSVDDPGLDDTADEGDAAADSTEDEIQPPECTTDDECALLLADEIDGCHAAACAAPGECVLETAPDESPCDDDDPCTTVDACYGGICTGGVPVVCEAAPACRHEGFCDSSTGACVYEPLSDRTHCTTDTITGVCDDGECTTCGDFICEIGEDASWCPGDCHPFVYAFILGDAVSSAMGGVAGADALCGNGAQTAGLPGQYKAWISTAGYSPATHFFHSPAPYVMPDGQLLASDWTGLTMGILVRQFNVNKLGQAYTSPFAIWSNTGFDGNILDPSMDCNGWTSASASLRGAYGSPMEGIGTTWTDRSDYPCGLSSMFTLACFGQELVSPQCGDGQCEYNEDCGNCSPDCGACPPTWAYAFITSTSYNGDLGGLAGADALCQARADAAGLPGTYRAWLSDATLSPANRFNRLACPYLTTTNLTVADDWTDLVSGALDSRLDIDEFGMWAFFASAWTNTTTSGTASSTDNCLNWTTRANSPKGGTGINYFDGDYWTDSGSIPCSRTTTHLYCFGQEALSSSCGDQHCTLGENPYNCAVDCSCGDGQCQADESTFTCPDDCYCGNGVCDAGEDCTSCDADCGRCEQYAYVFQTRTMTAGDMGGLHGADALCQTSADRAGLPGTYKAWLSDSVDSPATRFAHLDVPYVLPDGTVVGGDWADLVDGAIDIEIRQDEYGAGFGDEDTRVWTNTYEDGTPLYNTAAYNCSAWLSHTGTGNSAPTWSRTNWTSAESTTACNAPTAHLYCFGQEVVVETCGDGHCGAFETMEDCPADCTCGDGVCSFGESDAGCPEDCSCGDSVCSVDENCLACPGDCGLCSQYSLVFVTDTAYEGNLGGIAGANNKCQTAAAAAGLPGTYKAWISDGTTAPEDSFNRSSNYIRPDGAPVARDWADLTDGILDNPISVTESVLTYSGKAWTGVTDAGYAVGTADCNDWAAAYTLLYGMYGSTATNGSGWSNSNDSWTCLAPIALYCFQQDSFQVDCNDGTCTPGESAVCPLTCP